MAVGRDGQSDPHRTVVVRNNLIRRALRADNPLSCRPTLARLPMGIGEFGAPAAETPSDFAGRITENPL